MTKAINITLKQNKFHQISLEMNTAHPRYLEPDSSNERETKQLAPGLEIHKKYGEYNSLVLFPVRSRKM